MKTDTILRMALIIAILLITGFSLFSRIQYQRKMKKLAAEMAIRTDSLEMISHKYDSLTKGYQDIYKKLEKTRKGISSFKREVDSISQLRISDVKKIQKGLEKISEREQYSVLLKTDTTDGFRLN